MFLRKSFETEQEHVPGQAADLDLVRRYAQREVEDRDVWLGRMKLANTRVDRSGERFTKAYLLRFAETGPGKSVMPGHDYTQTPMGRFYKFAVVPDGDHYRLDAWYYLNAKNERLISDIELGILKDVSIGFNAGRRVCDLCGGEWDPYQGCADGHRPLKEYDGRPCTLTYCESQAAKAEMMEGSFVWHGCQYGAEAAAKAPEVALPRPGQLDGTATATALRGYLITAGWMPPKENGMDDLQKAMAEIERLKALPLAAEREKALLDEIEALKALKQKEPLITDGEKYRTFLASEILRLAGALGRKATYEAILKHMEAADAASLEAVLGELKPDYDAKFAGSGARTDLPETGGSSERPAEGKRQLLTRLSGGIL